MIYFFQVDYQSESFPLIFRQLDCDESLKEAFFRRRSSKQMFLKIFTNFIETPTQLFSLKILGFFYRTSPVAAPGLIKP